jgi:glycerol uptake facilitator protein
MQCQADILDRPVVRPVTKDATTALGAAYAASLAAGYFKDSPYFVAQMVGAGAILVWVHFLPHWEQTPDQGLKLACF